MNFICTDIGEPNGEHVEKIRLDGFCDDHKTQHIDLLKLDESWFRKSAQDDKWSFCLTVGTLCPANQERP
jgi:hypothetical protein